MNNRRHGYHNGRNRITFFILEKVDREKARLSLLTLVYYQPELAGFYLFYILLYYQVPFRLKHLEL